MRQTLRAVSHARACANLSAPRAISSAGRAPARQAGGHWFEPSIAHSSEGLYLCGFGCQTRTAGEIGLVAGIYPAVWGIGQIATGQWSDVVGRKPLIVAGMFVQSAALAAVAAVLLGVGAALVYPTLIAAISDAVSPVARAPVVGVYRFWRDSAWSLAAWWRELSPMRSASAACSEACSRRPRSRSRTSPCSEPTPASRPPTARRLEHLSAPRSPAAARIRSPARPATLVVMIAATHRAPGLPGDAQDDEGDRQADERVGDRQADGDDGR